MPVTLPDLLNAFVLQNALPPPAERMLRQLPPEVVMAVMRAGPLQQVPGCDVTAIFQQRVQQVAHDVQQQQQQQQAQQQAQQTGVIVPPPPPPHAVQQVASQQPQALVLMQMQMQAGTSAVQSSSVSSQPGHLGSVEAAQIQHAALTTQAPGMGQFCSSSGDPLTDFCKQNGVDGAVEHVLRSAPPELQVRVMQEGSLIGGNPSEVLILRVKRIMGQVPG